MESQTNVAHDESCNLLVSLDGGLTFSPAPNGIRIIYKDVFVPAEDELGELHLNATPEGLISDLWVTRDEPLDHNLGTQSQTIDDLAWELVDNPVVDQAPERDGSAERAKELRLIAVANRAFDGYNFGDGVEVTGANGWEYSTPGNMFCRAVFVEKEREDDGPAPSTRLIFTVTVDPNTASVLSAYAADDIRQIWGEMPKKNQVKVS